MKSGPFTFFGLLLISVLYFTGCNTIFPANKSIKNLFSKERPKTPSRMVSFWQCYAQTDPGGGSPLRGIGGRIIFYEEKNVKNSVKVDGDVTIYLFDANDPIPEKSVPIKYAIFKKDAVPSFYRKDELDIHGYDFFVPVDEIDNVEKDIQVLAIYKEEKKKGEPSKLLYSTPIVVTLIGSPKPGNNESEESKGEILRESSGPGSREISLAAGHDTTGNVSQAAWQNNAPKYTEDKSYTFPQDRPRAETITLPEYYSRAYNTEKWTPPKKEEPPAYIGDAIPYSGYYGDSSSQYHSHDNSRNNSHNNSRYSTGQTWNMPPQFRQQMPPQFRQQMPPQFHQETPQTRPVEPVTPPTDTTPSLQKEYEAQSETGISTKVFLGPPPGRSRF